jgi:hypothetical protein
MPLPVSEELMASLVLQVEMEDGVGMVIMMLAATVSEAVAEVVPVLVPV